MVETFIKAFLNIFKIEDLRKKVLFTLLLFVVYRIGAHIPTPGVDGKALAQFFEMISRYKVAVSSAS